MDDAQIITGDCIEQLRELPDESVQCCITSPPYWNLRDYGVENQIGLEENIQDYLDKLTEIFSQVMRILKADGTLWMNMGDSYVNHSSPGGWDPTAGVRNVDGGYRKSKVEGLRPKNMIGMPWRLAFYLFRRADGF